MKKIIFPILAVSVAVLFSGCGGGASTDISNTTASNDTTAATRPNRIVFGVAQKGPAIAGSMVSLYELDQKALRTGRSLKTSSVGSKGSFAIQIPESWGNDVEVILNGHFLDESTGNKSSSPIRLSAITTATQRNRQISVNLFTTLLHDRIKQLVKTKGLSIQEARASAGSSLQDVFGISAELSEKLDLTTLSHPQASAVTLFMSGAILELSGSHQEPLQRVIDQISTSFAIEGKLSGLGTVWEQRLKQLTLHAEDEYTNKYSSNVSQWLGDVERVPDGSNLPLVMRFTSRPTAAISVVQSGTVVNVVEQIGSVERVKVLPGSVVTLDGAASSDVDGQTLQYTWFQTGHDNSNLNARVTFDEEVTFTDRFGSSTEITMPDVADITLQFTLEVKAIKGEGDLTNTTGVQITDTLSVQLTTAEFHPEFKDESGNPVEEYEVQVPEGTCVNFTVYVSNPVNGALDFQTVSPPTNGQISYSQEIDRPDEALIQYCHNGTETAADTSVLSATNVRQNSTEIPINFIILPVNDSPIAEPDSATTDEDQPVTIDVLNNDSDPEGDSLSLVRLIDEQSSGTLITDAGGAVVKNPDDTITYTPDSGFFGTEVFSYEISDVEGKTATAEVTVIVNEVTNPPPVATNVSPVANDDEVGTEEGVPISIPVLSNDTDPDQDDLNVSLIPPGPTNGSALVIGNPSNPDLVIYTPDVGFVGTDTFSYQVDDGNGGADTATVFVTVNPAIVQNTPPIGEDDTTSTDEDVPIADIGFVLNNDTDLDSDTLSILSTTVPIDSAGLTVGSVINNSGTWQFTPNPNFNGLATFDYTVSDGNGGMDTATVEVTVKPVNDPPVAVDDDMDGFISSFGEDGSGSGSVTVNVITNDTDPDGDSLVLGSLTPSLPLPASIANVNTTVSGNSIMFDYDVNPSFFGPVGGLESFKFVYEVIDGAGGTDTGEVTITIIENLGSQS